MSADVEPLPGSGVPLRDAVGLNAAAGPFDHEAARREREAFLDEEARDPSEAAPSSCPAVSRGDERSGPEDPTAR